MDPLSGNIKGPKALLLILKDLLIGIQLRQKYQKGSLHKILHENLQCYSYKYKLARHCRKPDSLTRFTYSQGF